MHRRLVYLFSQGTKFYEIRFVVVLECFVGFSTQTHAESCGNYVKILFQTRNVRNLMKSRNLDMSRPVQNLSSGCPGIQELARTVAGRHVLTAVSGSLFSQKNIFSCLDRFIWFYIVLCKLIVFKGCVSFVKSVCKKCMCLKEMFVVKQKYMFH